MISQALQIIRCLRLNKIVTGRYGTVEKRVDSSKITVNQHLDNFHVDNQYTREDESYEVSKNMYGMPAFCFFRGVLL